MNTALQLGEDEDNRIAEVTVQLQASLGSPATRPEPSLKRQEIRNRSKHVGISSMAPFAVELKLYGAFDQQFKSSRLVLAKLSPPTPTSNTLTSSRTSLGTSSKQPVPWSKAFFNQF